MLYNKNKGNSALYSNKQNVRTNFLVIIIKKKIEEEDVLLFEAAGETPKLSFSGKVVSGPGHFQNNANSYILWLHYINRKK